MTLKLLLMPLFLALACGESEYMETPGVYNRTRPGNSMPVGSKLGFGCFYPISSPAHGPVAYHGNQLVFERSVVPHGGLVRFHCPIQRFHKLAGAPVVQCVDGTFNESLPTCDKALFEQRLVAYVEADYVLAPGGVFVVPPNNPVEITCRRTLEPGGHGPQWQWDANTNVFVKEGTFLVSPTSVLRLHPKEGTKGVFICYDGREDVILHLEARGDLCPNIPLSRGLKMRSNSIKADFACESPALLQGPVSVRCQHFRRWDREPPVCVYPECAAPVVDENGQVRAPEFPCTLPELSGALEAFSGFRKVRPGDVVAPGENVRFHCAPVGVFMLVGTSQLHCVKGVWSDQMPVCAFGVPNSLAVMMTSQHAVAPGGVVHVLPFAQVGLQCVSTDKNLPPQWMHDGEVNVTARESSDMLMSTSMLTFTANPGTDVRFTCTSHPESQWADTRTVHVMATERACPGISSTRGLRVRANYDMAVFSCDPPSQLIGASLLQCQPFGQWDLPVPRCVYPHTKNTTCSGDTGAGTRPVTPPRPAAKPVPKPRPAPADVRPVTKPAPIVVPVPDPDPIAEPGSDPDAQTESEDVPGDDRDSPAGAAPNPDVEVDTELNPDLDPVATPEDSPPLKHVAKVPMREHMEVIERKYAANMTDTGAKEPPKRITLKCPSPDGTFPYPLHCSKFMQCVSGVPRILQCPEGLLFSLDLQICRRSAQELKACRDRQRLLLFEFREE
ncbi:unnamed protein product [Ixodes pacificus]